ncbi:hypothetical protein V8C44DRAFT_331536 [Trichoderma aethiopicum]
MQVLFVLMPSHIQYLTAGCSSVPGRQTKLRMDGLSSLHRPSPPKSSNPQAVSKATGRKHLGKPGEAAPVCVSPCVATSESAPPSGVSHGHEHLWTCIGGHLLLAQLCKRRTGGWPRAEKSSPSFCVSTLRRADVPVGRGFV